MREEAVDLSPVSCSTILVVEDDRELRIALCDTLSLVGYRILQAGSAEEALNIVENTSGIDLVISDVNMGVLSGRDLLKNVRQNHPHIPVLLITAYASISDSVGAIKEGAVDYLVKPFEPDMLVALVNKYVGHQNSDSDEPIAAASSSKQLLQLARRVAQSESTVLLVGESGTGKEVLARYIHEKSPRAGKPFVAINCAAIPENMLEAILFGHEKGAYTGAHSSSPGKFEQADGGTLLLDEISEMELGLQAKLLRVLQEREVERLGGRKNIQLNVRVIATSNRDIQSEVAAGKFREDLYFRLSVLPLNWKPLRERRDDILPLAAKMLSRHALKQRRRGVKFTTAAEIALQEYSWPGNVRELDNAVQRALILQAGTEINPEDLGVGMENRSENLFSGSLREESCNLHEHESATLSPAEEEKPMLGDGLREREYEIIMKTLREQKGSKKRTAEALGISARTLRYKFSRLREIGYNFDLF